MRHAPTRISGPTRALLLLAIGCVALPGTVAALDLPVLRPGRDVIADACWRADRFELRLAPAASREAAGARALGRVPVGLSGAAAVDRLAAELNATIEPMFAGETAPTGPGAIDFTAFHLVSIPEGVPLQATLARFAALPGVQSTLPIGIVPVSAPPPNDSLFFRCYWLDQVNGHHAHALEAWDVTRGDSSILVAVLDTGMIPYHPDLGGILEGSSGNVFVNRTEQSGVPGVDDDGNGFVDDVSGWDFVAQTVAPADSQPGEDYRTPDPDPNDYAGHGTVVSGIVAAMIDNGIGPVGVAPGVRLLPVRMGWSTNSAPLGLVDMAQAAQGIRYATRLGANVINCSFSTLDQAGLGAAASAATRAGITIVSAAGNSSQPHDLANRVDVISVAATNEDDLVASFSNRGDYVDLAAAGVRVTSTYIARPSPDSIGRRQPAYIAPPSILNGTSFSAPQVAGAAALLQSQRRAAGVRLLHPMEVQLRLRETADDITAFNTLTGYGTGRLNLARALTDRRTSRAWGAGARTVGAAVPLAGPSLPRLAWATTDQHLLIVDPIQGDTIANVLLPAAATRSIAAGDIGGTLVGPMLFVGLANGRVAGFDSLGNALPGWPVLGPGGSTSMQGGPALGDLDGDGLPEIVCADDFGEVWAWHGDGTRVANFPVPTNASGVGVPVALADLDGVPGVEIAVITRDGELHALRGDASELTGFPLSLGISPAAPVIADWHGVRAVVVAGGNQVFAFHSDGSPRFTATVPGSVFQDPALGDLDGDGADEVIVACSNLHRIAALDSSGADVVGFGWPATLDAPAASAPLLGPLGSGPLPDVLIMKSGGLYALGDSARALSNFPKPGGAGSASTLLDLDADGATDVAAGAGPDSVLYVYDAGLGTAGGAAPWPTLRGNFARSGARVDVPAFVREDRTAPAAIDDLAGERVEADSVSLEFTAPGDDAAVGRARAYEWQITTDVLAIGDFATGQVFVDPSPPDTAGTLERRDFSGLTADSAWVFAVRSVDEWGNRSANSNVAQVGTVVPPPPGRPLSLAARGDGQAVTFFWSGAGGGGQRIVLFDLLGRRRAEVPLGAGVQGTERWNPIDRDGRRLRAGLYFARLESGGDEARARVVWVP